MKIKLFLTFICIIVLSSCVNNSTPQIDSNVSNHNNYVDPNLSSHIISSKVAYDMLYPIYDGIMYGFIDKEGNVIIEPQYDAVGEFSDGLAYVEQAGLCGYIDLIGEVAVPLTHENCGNYSDGLATVLKNNLYGYINKTGKLVIDYKFKYAGEFSEGIAKVVTVENEYSTTYIDLNGDIVISFESRNCGDVNDGIIRVYASYYDLSGTELFSDWFFRNGIIEHSPYDFSEGLSVYPVLKKEYWDTPSEKWADIYFDWSNWEYTYRDVKGKQVLDVYEYAESFSEGLAIVKKDDRYMVVDATGEIAFTNDNLVSNCKEGFFIYCQKNKYGFINRQGDISIIAQYDEVLKPFTNGLALVKKDTKEMYINKTGEIVWAQG